MNATSGMADSRAAVRPNMLVRTAILAFLWWLIAQGQTNAWLIGLPAVALAAMASVYLGRARLPGISLTGLIIGNTAEDVLRETQTAYWR